MKLMMLKFDRGYCREENSPLVGMAEFKDERGSTIQLTLDQEQAAKVMAICQESMARELQRAAEAMSQSLKSSIEFRKATEIGREIPRSW